MREPLPVPVSIATQPGVRPRWQMIMEISGKYKICGSGGGMGQGLLRVGTTGCAWETQPPEVLLWAWGMGVVNNYNSRASWK